MEARKRFKDEYLYQYKYVNVRDYMRTKVADIRAKQKEYRMTAKRARLEREEANRARADMRVRDNPEKGSYIQISH